MSSFFTCRESIFILPLINPGHASVKDAEMGKIHLYLFVLYRDKELYVA